MHDLTDLPFINFCQPQICLTVDLRLNVRTAQGEVDIFVEQRRHRSRSFDWRAAARKGQKLLGQLFCPEYSNLSFVQAGEGFTLRVNEASGERKITGNRRQDVIEIM